MLRPAVFSLVLLLAIPAFAETPAAPEPDASAAEESGMDEDRMPATGAARMKDAKAPYPRAVRRLLDISRRDCRAEGGRAITFRPGAVRVVDLDGDGRDDYVLDSREIVCADRPAMFNGTGGWDLDILVAKPKGGFAWVFSGRVRDYDISDGPGARTMTFHLHGGFCGLAGADDCVKTRRMSARPFEFRDR